MEPKFNSTAFMWQMLKSGRESAREEGDPYRIEEAERQISGTARNILKNPSLITRLKLDGYDNYVEEMQAFVTSSSAPSSSAQPDLINMVQFEEFLGVLTDAQLAAVEAAVLAERTKRRAS